MTELEQIAEKTIEFVKKYVMIEQKRKEGGNR